MPPTPAQLASLAHAAFPPGLRPALLRRLQTLRPYICPFEHLLDFVPPHATVLDIGCGGGLWLRLLEATGRARLAIGFDSSAPAIALANASRPAAPHPGDLRFLLQPAQAPWPGPPDFPATFAAVSIIDVIHHVPPAAHESVIRQAAARVAPGGVLIYKDMAARPRWRAAANRLHDLALARQWIHYAHPDAVQRWAAAEGLTLTHRARHHRLWYAHDLVVMSRP